MKKSNKNRNFNDITAGFLSKAKEKTKKNALTKAKLKESTYSRYSFLCEKHILSYFENMEVSKINNECINKFINYKLKNGGLDGEPLSPKTVNDMVCLLLQILKPYRYFDMDIEKPSCRQKEVSIFTKKEYNKLKEYLSIGTDSKKLGIIVAMLTGIRIGELCALKWEHIDLENATISINNTIQRIKTNDAKGSKKTKIIIDTPKSDMSIRSIPIPEILLAKLIKFKADNNSYILTNSPQYIEPRVYMRHFKECLQSCKIKDNNFHTLRHTFATMAIARGIDIKTVSVLLGHSDVAFTMKIYVHPDIEHRRVQIEKLAIGF